MSVKIVQWRGDIHTLPFVHEFLNISTQAQLQYLISGGVHTLVLTWHNQRAWVPAGDFIFFTDQAELKGYDRHDAERALTSLAGEAGAKTFLDAVETFAGIELQDTPFGGISRGTGSTGGKAFYWRFWKTSRPASYLSWVDESGVLYYKRVQPTSSGEQSGSVESGDEESGGSDRASPDGERKETPS